MESESEDSAPLSDDGKLATFAPLAAGVTTLVGVLGGLTFTGVIERAARNAGEWVAAAFVLVVLAGAFFVWDGLSRTPSRSGENPFWKGWAKLQSAARPFGILFMIVGLVIAVVTVINTYDVNERPEITAHFEEGSVLKAQIHAAGLQSSEDVGVQVTAYSPVRTAVEKEAPAPSWEPYRMFENRFGPNAAGVIDHSVSMSIPPGFYQYVTLQATTEEKFEQCFDLNDAPLNAGVGALDPNNEDEDGEGTQYVKKELHDACALLELPRAYIAPDIEMTTRRVDKSEVAVVRVKAHHALLPVEVVVVANTPGNRIDPILAEAIINPGETGSLDRQLKATVPARATAVCAIAAWDAVGAASTDCPPEHAMNPSWVRIKLAARRDEAPKATSS